MKNIHILPTDKPSRLLCNHTLKSFCFQKEENGMFVNDGKVSGASFWSIEKAKNNGFNPQHIYITSDEEIKEGDWIVYCNSVYKVLKVNINKRPVVKMSDGTFEISYYKKIILTTDQDLIKDGVQPIDDEFLEWFVKNPSCEEVKTRKIGEEWIYNADVPKEPKQEENEIIDISDHDGIGNAVDNLNNEPPQETTIEEIRKYAELSYYNGDEINAFVNGAKWQQERMYSEEEVIEIAKRYAKRCQATIQDTKWFEQLKKK